MPPREAEVRKANAIYEAVGMRMTELPVTPERVLRALGKVS